MLEKLIVFVEEYSMEATLEQLLPKLLADIEFQIIRFQCKDDLLKKAPERLRGYATWLPENWRILVLVDRDDDDCVMLKAVLENMAAAAGLQTKTTAGQDRAFQVVNRIAIEELIELVAKRTTSKNDLTAAILKASKECPFPKKTKGIAPKSAKVYLNFVLLIASHHNADAKLIALMDEELKKANPDYKTEIDIYGSEGIHQRGNRIETVVTPRGFEPL